MDHLEPSPVVDDEGAVGGWGCLVVILLCLAFLAVLVAVGSVF